MRRYYKPVPKRNIESAGRTTPEPLKKANVGDNFKAVQDCEDFDNQTETVSDVLSSSRDSDTAYKIRLKSTVECARYLLMQGESFYEHDDDSSTSTNKGNLLEMVDWYKGWKEEVRRAFDVKDRGDCDLTSPCIQKDIAKACSQEVTKAICEEIGDSRFSIIIVDTGHMADRYQMAVIVRFLNKRGETIERFLGLEQITEDTSAGLEIDLVRLLARHGLSISRLRGQGYDGVSSMREEYNGLQRLVLDKNPYAFYVHSFAHPLESLVVSVSSCCPSIANFFNQVSLIVTTVITPCEIEDAQTKRHHQTILEKLEAGEIFSEGGEHDETNLARLGDTRWGSHHTTLSRIHKMWDSVLDALVIVCKDGRFPNRAGGLIEMMESFEFVFNLKLMLKLYTITNELSLVLQRKDEDIVQAMRLLGDVKERLEILRNNGWEPLLEDVESFCAANSIPVPNMEERVAMMGRSRHHGLITQLRYYRSDTLFAVVDSIRTEMDHRFNAGTVDLLVCFSSLHPRNNFSQFNAGKLARLAGIFADDFPITDHALIEHELQNNINIMRKHVEFTACHDIASLAVKMVETGKHLIFPLLYCLIELALLLPVSTASVNRTFSALNIIHTDLCNRIHDDCLNDFMVCFTEQEVFKKLEDETIMERFQSIQNSVDLSGSV